MKRVEITIDDYLYEFYKKIGDNIGVKTEQIIADTLLKFAGDLSEKMKSGKSPVKNS
ncbi:MAG TPA: hypothetical protein PK854_02380 [Oscillospiraceae bacterium]|nr:hypothetical protein [Oscillospiraceae bacterium]HPS34091.1 hypothetical protein [Oscillospiraceae bacterium]